MKKMFFQKEKIRHLSLKKSDYIAFLSVFLFGVVTHGYAFSHNFQLHDNVYNFYMGGTYASGRWMLGILTRLTDLLSGGNYHHYSAPWYLGMLSLTWIGISAVLIVRLLEIKNTIISAMVGAIMVSFPVVTATFGFMFTSGMYFFGLMLGIAGLFIVCMLSNWLKWQAIPLVMLGVLLEAMCVGVYQAYVPVILALNLIYFLKQMNDAKEIKAFKVMLRVGYYLANVILFMTTYWLILKCRLTSVGTQLSGYQGIGENSSRSIYSYFAGIISAYKEFFIPSAGKSYNMYPGAVLIYYRILLAFVVVLLVYTLVSITKKNKFAGIMSCIAMLFFPLAANFIFVMGSSDIHSLMVYGEVGVFILFCYLLNKINLNSKILKMISVLVYGAILILYFRYANICYLKADYLQQAANSYFNRLSTRIESIDGYEPGMTVLYVGNSPCVDETVFPYSEFDYIVLMPYGVNTIINDYNWIIYMQSECGTNYNMLSYDVFKDNMDIDIDYAEMPHYPASGSIKKIGDYIVVNF